MKKILVFCILTGSVLGPMQAQTGKSLDESIFTYRYSEATAYLEDEHIKGKADNSLLLGRIYFQSRAYEKALEYLRIAGQKGIFQTPEDYFMLTDVLRRKQLTGEAHSWQETVYNQFGTNLLKPVPYQPYDSTGFAGATAELQTWNEPASEMIPWYWKGTLFFASDRTTSANLNQHQALDGSPFYEMYFLDDTGKQGTSISLAGKYSRTEKNSALDYWKNNLVHFHQTPPCILGDSLIILSGNTGEKEKIGNGRQVLPSYLYLVRKNKKGNWGKPEKIPFVQDGFDYIHPAFDVQTGCLVFSSNMPGGQGSYDIWKARLTSSGWETPVNLQELNTPFREVFPTADPQGTIYFSSDGYDGKGGLDILIWQQNRLFFPQGEINSHMDDFSVCPINDSTGYFCSDRLGSGHSDDIYRYYLVKETPAVKLLTLIAMIRDGNSKEPLKDVSIRLVNRADTTEVIQFNTGDKGVVQGRVKEFTGADTANYRVEISKGGYIKRIADFSLFLNDDFEIDIDELLSKDSLWLTFRNEDTSPFLGSASDLNNQRKQTGNNSGEGGNDPTNNGSSGKNPGGSGNTSGQLTNDPGIELTPLSVGFDVGEYLRLGPIYFDYNLWNIKNVASAELEKVYQFLVENPTVSIELAAYTDSRGTNEWNLELSANRAYASAQYLIRKGISSERITYKGYGESGIVNRCTDGVECTEEEHAQNRRTEFKIINY